jgi:hypothetical protein
MQILSIFLRKYWFKFDDFFEWVELSEGGDKKRGLFFRGFWIVERVVEKRAFLFYKFLFAILLGIRIILMIIFILIW